MLVLFDRPSPLSIATIDTRDVFRSSLPEELIVYYNVPAILGAELRKESRIHRGWLASQLLGFLLYDLVRAKSKYFDWPLKSERLHIGPEIVCKTRQLQEACLSESASPLALHGCSTNT